jgi:hypothetical protein
MFRKTESYIQCEGEIEFRTEAEQQALPRKAMGPSTERTAERRGPTAQLLENIIEWDISRPKQSAVVPMLQCSGHHRLARVRT